VLTQPWKGTLANRIASLSSIDPEVRQSFTRIDVLVRLLGRTETMHNAPSVALDTL